MRGRELPRGVRNFIFNILARIVFIRLDYPKREGEEEPEVLSPGSTVPGIPPRKLPAVIFRSKLSIILHKIRFQLLLDAQGDTWRIVYPDMPSPPNVRTCEAHRSLLDVWKRGEVEQNNM